MTTPPDAPQEVRGIIYDPGSGVQTRLVLPYDSQSRERIVEQMARAMAEKTGYATEDDFEFEWSNSNQWFRDAWLNYARAALTAIEPKENK